MATTIKSTGLDFNAIKNNLKTFLAAQDEFTDYNFEASGLSNLLDVLAYNTHYNALIANFALNESFLGTAQLRSSLVSLSEGIGYIPDSRTASFATVRLSVDLSGESNLPNSISIASGFKFTAEVDDISYTFQTLEPVTATNSSGIYQFITSDGNADIKIFEGVAKTKTFIAGPQSESDVYVVPDKNLDLSTVIVKVFENSTATSFSTYQSILEATAITESSTLYVLKEAPNGYYELSFGNGTTLGKAPEASNKIEVDYLAANGAAANGAKTFVPNSKLTVNLLNGSTVQIDVDTVTQINSAGGSEKETIESIRKNAPFQYAAQNRMVTAADYASLVLRNFSSLISDIKAWGGEDNDIPEYGTAFLSIRFLDNVSDALIEQTKKEIIDLSDQLSVVSFNLKFTDPVVTYIEVQVIFQFNPQLTTLSLNTIESQVNDAIRNYFETSVGRFEESFRRSNLLTAVDEVSPAVLSSRALVKMQQRLVPEVTITNNDGTTTTISKLGVAQDYQLRFPAPIESPQTSTYTVISSQFNFRNRACIVRNKLGTNILQVIDLSTQEAIVDNAGSFTSVEGKVNFTGFAPDSISGGSEFIKVSAVPANQSAVSPVRNNVLEYDEDISFASGSIVSST